MRNYTPRPKTGLPQKKPKTQLKRTRIKPRSDKAIKEIKDGEGMLDFFIEVWNSRKSGQLFVARDYATAEEWREHTSQYRVDCVTYMPILHMEPANFMHVLTKRRYSRWKKVYKNICMGSFETHQIQEFQAKSKLVEHGPGGFWFNEYKEKLKEEITMSNKHTPIKQWIEDAESKASIESPLYNAKHGFKNGCYQLLTYLGLQDINDPKNHIRHLEFRANEGLQTSKELEDFKENAERLSLKYSFKIESLEAENERLKELLKKIVHSEEFKQCHNLKILAKQALKGE